MCAISHSKNKNAPNRCSLKHIESPGIARQTCQRTLIRIKVARNACSARGLLLCRTKVADGATVAQIGQACGIGIRPRWTRRAIGLSQIRIVSCRGAHKTSRHAQTGAIGTRGALGTRHKARLTTRTVLPGLTGSALTHSSTHIDTRPTAHT